jgi:hypothetical protein
MDTTKVSVVKRELVLTWLCNMNVTLAIN